ncbi:peptide chain release factor N(5)-glutamine methyltransferase [Halomonas sp. ANAO-440]|uniref:peptide chain release factor N(5)-glutamine methyltransferase n=1 Tax=Halomonas sp. ANAO-440 TaxID=2861360 RepID=UPI001CAA4457|nr:peptide chain release factor N(5)-glutamine methyltransferase [Halomonas sp. ANAO-440]MBZ0329026.1 peptide chain release factor N(5)-glutamine methyltransferase [Halomonas sp. ANAO-440]
MDIDSLLGRATERLAQAGSASPRLDAEVLLGHVLGVDRTWLYTWGDRAAPVYERARFEALVAVRAEGHPVAYLIGEREFWGLALSTSPHTLIPRPDTETLVEAALELAPSARGRLLDMGTGTGAIALAFASERPGWQITGIDRIEEAVGLAVANAERLGIANASFLVSDWFSALPADGFDLIVANPPYIADSDPHLMLGDVRFEPVSALVAGEDGLADLRRLIELAPRYLLPGGWLAMEHGHDQAERVRQLLQAAGYREVASRHDLSGQQRVTLGRLAG